MPALDHEPEVDENFQPTITEEHFVAMETKKDVRRWLSAFREVWINDSSKR